MAFISVSGSYDQEQEDAVRRGVADGLARLLGVPAHPQGVQEMLDRAAQAETGPVRTPDPATAGSVRNAR